MTYAVVVNLDYETQPDALVKEMWGVIKQYMLAAGFHRAGRRFTIDLPEDQACEVARKVMAAIELDAKFHDQRVYDFLKDFYGYDLDSVTNLLMPPVDSIVVKDVSDR